MAWQNSINHAQSGAPGRASTVSGPDRQLEGNLQYLKDRFDAANLGTAMFAYNQPVEADAQVGMPVYWNYAQSRYERALAATETVNGVVTIADSADVVGIVYSKSASTIATIMTLGIAPVDITNAVDGTPAAGRYYLSAAEAGKLVAQSPPASVLVLRNHGNGDVHLAPTSRIMAQDHQHISFELTAAPAGGCNTVSPGGTHTVVAPDVNIPGWLPAGHASFNGNAPADAKFGYNLAAHPELAQLWPPIPIEAAVLEMVRSDDVNGQVQVLGRVAPDLVQFTTHGIWWMSDCYNEAPWPVDCSTTSSRPSLGPCPILIDMQLILSFVRMTFHTS